MSIYPPVNGIQALNQDILLNIFALNADMFVRRQRRSPYDVHHIARMPELAQLDARDTLIVGQND